MIIIVFKHLYDKHSLILFEQLITSDNQEIIVMTAPVWQVQGAVILTVLRLKKEFDSDGELVDVKIAGKIDRYPQCLTGIYSLLYNVFSVDKILVQYVTW